VHSAPSFQLFSVPIAGGAAVRLDSPVVPDTSVSSFSIGPASDRVVYLGEKNTRGVEEAFSVPLGGGASIKLNPALAPQGIADDVTRFFLSRDGTRAAYLADAEADEAFELFGLRVPDGLPVRLNGNLVRGGSVTEYSVDGEGTLAVYVADQEEDERFELYGRKLDGAAPVKLSGQLVPGGDVTGAVLSPFESRVVYRADQDVDGTYELYTTSGGPPVKLSRSGFTPDPFRKLTEARGRPGAHRLKSSSPPEPFRWTSRRITSDGSKPAVSETVALEPKPCP